MNNMLKRLVVAALAISASHVSAHTNRNFLSSPRAQHASQLLDSHVTRDLAGTKGKDRFGGNFLVSGFYSESMNKKALGKYFGIKDQDSFKAVIGAAVAGDRDLDLGLLAHDATVARAAAANGATVRLAPKTVSYGVEFAYVQDLCKVLEGLHLSISLPVERVENNMNLTVANVQGNLAADNITKFLAGNLTVGRAANAPFGTANQGNQLALKNALINGKQGATGIADIDVLLGYDFVRNEDWTAGLNIGLVIPTGNSATGKYVFEPIYGNGGHWELGFGGRVDGRLWREGDQRINLHLGADYRYGFQANETRTLGLNNKDWAQYYLGGVIGATARNAMDFAPLANGLTKPLSVTPGSALRGNLGLEYGNGGFLFGLFYAPAWRQAESVKFNEAVTDGATAVLHAETEIGGGNFTNAAPGTRQDAAAAGGSAFLINRTDISTEQATRPSQVAHRLGADMGYTFRNWEYPVAIGVGGHYELAGDNAVAENWGINIKAGIGF